MPIPGSECDKTAAFLQSWHAGKESGFPQHDAIHLMSFRNVTKKSTTTYKCNKTGGYIGRCMHLISSTQGKIIHISKIDLWCIVIVYLLFNWIPIRSYFGSRYPSGVHLAGRAVAVVGCGSCLFVEKIDTKLHIWREQGSMVRHS